MSQEERVACSNCFKNEGLASEARKVGIPEQAECARCGSKDGHHLTGRNLELLAHHFFERGSVSSAVTGFASVYAINKTNRHPANFDFSLRDDASLISSILQVVIFNYGPPFWQLGKTDHHHILENGTDEERSACLAQFIATSEEKTLREGEKIFRIRKNLKGKTDYLKDFDTPPPGTKKSFNRFDEDQFPIFYGSQNLEVCLHECRVTLQDEITVGTLVPLRPLKLLDLASPLKGVYPTPFQDPNIFLLVLNYSAERGYEFSRLIAKEIELRKFDGFYFRSYYSQVKNEPAVNIALFGHPVNEGKLSLTSVNRVRLTEANYEYQFGPVL